MSFRSNYRDADFESVYAEYTITFSEHWSARANYNWNRGAVKNKLTGIADARMFPNGVNFTTTGTGYTVLGGTSSVEPGSGLTTITGTYGSFSFDPRSGAVTNNLRPGAWALLPRRARLQEEFGQGNAYQAEVAGKYQWTRVGWKPLFGAFLNHTRSRGRTREIGDFYLPWNLLDASTWVDRPSPLAQASAALRADGTYDVAALPESNSSVSFGRDTAYYTAQSLRLLDDRLMLLGGARYNRVESRGDNLRVAPAAVFEISQFDRVLNFSERVGTQSLTTQLQDTEDKSKGWEIEATLSPLDHWQVYVSYADIDVKLTSVPAGLEPLLGARPEASVKQVFNIWTRYTIANGLLKGAWIGAGANYTGEKAQRVDNRLLRMPEYTLYDATIGYDWKGRERPIGATIAWKNISDEEYFPANQQRGLPSRVLGSVMVKF